MISGFVLLATLQVGKAWSGNAADNPKLQGGVGWLATHQYEGAWPANYLNKQRNPQDNVGKFMRDAATAFAILALSESSEPGLGIAAMLQPEGVLPTGGDVEAER
jgi:hypothetical protein